MAQRRIVVKRIIKKRRAIELIMLSDNLRLRLVSKKQAVLYGYNVGDRNLGYVR